MDTKKDGNVNIVDNTTDNDVVDVDNNNDNKDIKENKDKENKDNKDKENKENKENDFYCVKLDTDEKYLIESKDKIIVIYNLEQKRMIRYIRHHNLITSLSMAPEGVVTIGDNLGHLTTYHNVYL